MNEESSNVERDSALARLGRSLGQSRGGQWAAATLVAALFCWLAHYAWHHPDLAAVALSMWLLIYGLEKAWSLLPISAATRARWGRRWKIAEGHPVGRCRVFLWVGILMLVSDWWRDGSAAPVDFVHWIIPGIAIVVGTVSYLAWWRFLRKEQGPDL